MSLLLSQHKATNLVCRVLISMLLYSFSGEAALSPSLAPHSQHHSHPLIPAPPTYTQHPTNPIIPPPFHGETTPPPDSQPHSHPLIPATPPHSQHHSHPLIPAPDTAAPPYLLLPPTMLPYPHHHYHHAPPPTNGGVGTVSPLPSPQAHHPHHHHHHHHHHHQHHHSLPPTSAVPFPSPYLSPPFDFNSPPPLTPHAYPVMPNPITQSPAAAPSNHPFKSTSPPPPRKYGP